MKFNAPQFAALVIIHTLLCLGMVVYYISKNDENNALIFAALFYTSEHSIVHVYYLMQDYRALKSELEKYQGNQDESTHNPITLNNEIQRNGLQLVSTNFYAIV